MPMFYKLEPYTQKQNCIIVDIDDTVARTTLNVSPPDMSSQPVGTKLRDIWDKYHKDIMYYDLEYIEPLNSVITLIEAYIHFTCNPKVIFMTGREDNENGLIRLNTYRFISKNFEQYNRPIYFNYETILMRPKDDYRPNDVVKEELLTKYVLPEYNVLIAFDDNEANAKMFKNYGITTIQPHIV